MPILTVLIVCVAIGILLWAVNTYIPMDPAVRKITNIVVIIILVVFLLRAFGVFEALSGARI